MTAGNFMINRMKIIISYTKTSPTPRVKRFPDKTLDNRRSYGHSLVTHPLWTNSGSSFLVPCRVTQNMHSGSSVERIEQECHRSAKYKKRDMETQGSAPWHVDVWCQATVAIYITAHNSLRRWTQSWHCVTSNWWHHILDLSIPNWSLTNANDCRMRLVLDTCFGLVLPVNCNKNRPEFYLQLKIVTFPSVLHDICKIYITWRYIGVGVYKLCNHYLCSSSFGDTGMHDWQTYWQGMPLYRSEVNHEYT